MYLNRASLALVIGTALAMATLTSNAMSAEPPPEAVVKKISAAIRTHCPEARFEIEEGEKFVARYATMTFTLHNRSKAGEISPQTHQAEGPNHRGFKLTLWQEPGPYEGAAAVPQTLEGPYFPTFIDAVPTADGRGHRRVSFSYGRHVDEKLKQAIFAALSESGFLSLAPKQNEK